MLRRLHDAGENFYERITQMTPPSTAGANPATVTPTVAGRPPAEKRRLNWSTLKHIATSPRLMKWRVEHPMKDSEALIMGRSIHCAILEPEKFDGRWIQVSTCGATTGKGEPCKSEGSLYSDGKWFCKVKGHAPAGAMSSPGEGIEVITAEGIELTRLCAESVAAHGPASKILKGGKAEQGMEWTDPETGIECRGRVDYLRPDDLVDLKTTRRETIREFTADAARMLYHGQLAWYMDGAIAAGRLPKDAGLPYVVAVSTAEPYDVAAFQLSEISLEAGRILVRDLVKKYQQCVAADLWPGVAPDLAVLDLPAWAPGMQGSEDSEIW